MHEKFVEEIKKLTGKAIKSIGVGENESHMLLQLHVGDEHTRNFGAVDASS